MAYINAEKVKAIRTEIKKAFPKWKISVRKEHNSTVIVSILSADIDFIREYKGPNVPKGDIQVNHYYIDHAFSGAALESLEKIKEIANAGNHDRSDTQSDYFDVGWYFSLNIGEWNKPFVLIS